MKTRYTIPIVVALAIVGGLQAWSTVDCLNDEGTPGFFTCTTSFIDCAADFLPKDGRCYPVEDVLSENQVCAYYFDKSMKAWIDFAEEQQSDGATWEPPSQSHIVFESPQFHKWRYLECDKTVLNWAYISENQEWIWNSGINWQFHSQGGDYRFTTLEVDSQNKVDLTHPDIPRDSEHRVDYHDLVVMVSKHYFSKLLGQQHIEHDEDDIFLMVGPWFAMYTEYSNACGYVLTADEQVLWLESEIDYDTLTKAEIMEENPMPCKPNHTSCFCEAQIHMTKKTLDELTYFTSEEESKYAEILLDYIQNDPSMVNIKPEFLLGKYNLEYEDSNAVAYCGERPGDNRNDFFEGAFVNDVVKDYSLERELSPLCAISNDAEWHERK